MGSSFGEFEKPTLNALHEPRERPALVFRQIAQCIVDGVFRDWPDQGVQTFRLVGEVETIDATIKGVRATLDPTFSFHAVNQSACGRLFNFQ